MKTIYKHIFSVVLLFTSVLSLAAESEKETMIFKAMEDELARSMTELSYKEYAPPFYISYFVKEFRNSNIQASLGAVIESSSDKYVDCGHRLLVGSYQLNDEKFNDKVNRVWYNDGWFSRCETPNYYGIRRSLWLSSNNSFKSASEVHKNKCDLMEKEGLSVDDMKAPDFSQEPKVEYIEQSLADEKDQTFFEMWAKDISLAFENYTDVISSDVNIKYVNQTNYMLSSEGSRTQIPMRLYTVTVKAKILSKENKPMSQVLRYYAKSYDDLPNKDAFKNDIAALVNNLYALRDAPKYKGKYDGPVLVQNEAVFYKNIISLVRRGSGIMSNPRGFVNDANKGMGLADYFTWEDMKGKRVIDKKLSMTALPNMVSYEDVPLLGSVKCDNEGVMTPDKLELINDGILKNQLNNRTPTPSQLNSNGHRLPYYKNNSLGSQVGPSVLKLESNEVTSLDSLYIQLSEIAKEEDLDYAFIIKPLVTNADDSPINTYKFDLETGEETLISGTDYMGTVSELKKIEAVGNEQILTNALVANQSAMDSQRKKMAKYPDWYKDLIRIQMGDEGSPASFIYPNAFLIKSTTVNGANNSSSSKPRVVPSPLVMQ